MLLPIMLLIAGGWLIVQVAGVDVAGAVQAVFMPLHTGPEIGKLAREQSSSSLSLYNRAVR